MADERIHDWHSGQQLLLDWSRQACVNRARSSRRAKRYKKLHNALGIPVIMFSSIVGSAAFTQIHQAPNNTVRIFAGVLSIVSAILAGLQTFFGFGESAEKYRAVGIGYEKIEKDIEEILALPGYFRDDFKQQIDNVREQMNTLADDSPEIPGHKHPEDDAHKANPVG